jgi:hypothetical protein
LPVDGVETERGHFFGEPAMQKDHTVDLEQSGLLEQPGAVLAVMPEGAETTEVSRRKALLEGRFELLQRYPGAIGVAESLHRPVPGLLVLLGQKVSETLLGNISEVSRHVHDFVVAQQRVNTASRRQGLGLEASNQIQNRAIVGSAIHQIADEYQVVLAADPAQILVYQTGSLEQRQQFVVRAVDITDDHHPRHISPLPLGGCGGSRRYLAGGKKRHGESSGVQVLLVFHIVAKPRRARFWSRPPSFHRCRWP